MAGLYDDFLAVARATGEEFGSHSFSARLRTQKTAFLMKALGLDVPHDFNLYVRGPYSRSFAAEYYGWETPVRPDVAESRSARPSEELERVMDILVEAVTRENDFLEVASTAIVVGARHPGIESEKAIERLCSLKPQLASLAPEAWRWVEDRILGTALPAN